MLGYLTMKGEIELPFAVSCTTNGKNFIVKRFPTKAAAYSYVSLLEMLADMCNVQSQIRVFDESKEILKVLTEFTVSAPDTANGVPNESVCRSFIGRSTIRAEL